MALKILADELLFLLLILRYIAGIVNLTFYKTYERCLLAIGTLLLFLRWIL